MTTRARKECAHTLTHTTSDVAILYNVHRTLQSINVMRLEEITRGNIHKQLEYIIHSLTYRHVSSPVKTTTYLLENL